MPIEERRAGGGGCENVRVGCRRHDSRADGEQRARPRGDVGRPAKRFVLHAGEHPPGAVGGGLHRRRLRRSGDPVLARDARHVHAARRGASAGATRRRAHRRRRAAGMAPVSGVRRGRVRPAPSRRIRRPTPAVLRGQYGAPQGHPTAAGAGDRRDRDDHPGVRSPWCGRGFGVPEPRTAVPHGTRDVDDVRAGGRCHHGGHGALRRRGGVGVHRGIPGDPRAVRADDVRPHAEAARGRAGHLLPAHPAARRARRRPVPAGRQAADDRVVGADRRRVLRILRGGRYLVHPRRGVAPHPGSVTRRRPKACLSVTPPSSTPPCSGFPTT